MHLKEIQMENFKTFRKKVSIPIFKGFTGITGPNGSGKSNVADAVLFVLGPRSSKMVRAKKLSDLIFHGNDHFKAAKECKVSLIFDNTDRQIPIDTDEVSLKRVLRVSQTDPDNTLSYFYVNGHASSQTEFENILTHAHLSAEGYNIVLQGQISEFVNKTPAKIREEIDEIAGIRKYDDEIKLSLGKKERTQANMERINWHLDFIKGRLKDLKREKEEAERYREAQQQINLSKALLFTVQREAVEGELGGYRSAIDNAEKRKISLKGELDRLESERKRTEDESAAVEREIADITGEEGKKLKSKLDEARLELMRAKDAIETSGDSLNELNKERSARELERKDTKKKIAGLEKELEALEKDIAGLDKDKDGAKGEVEKLEGELERTDTDLLNLRRDLGKAVKELESERDQLSAKVLEKDRAAVALDLKRSSLSDIEQMLSTLDYEVKDLKEQLKDVKKSSPQEKVAKVQKEFMSKRAEEKRLGERMRELEKEITSLNRLYTQMKVELETTEKISKGVSMAVEDILTARDTGEIRGIFGTIGELGNVPDQYSKALEVAAGARISAVVVEDDEVAAKCIERLKKKKAGRATFLPLNKVSSKRPGPKALMVKDDEHAIGLAVDLVKFDKRYDAAFSWAFGDTVVVDDLSTLRRLMGGIRIVTMDGELAGVGGDITGGELSKKQSQGPGFGKRAKSELEDISNQLRDRIAESETLTAELNEIRELVGKLETELRQMTGDQTDLEGRRGKLEDSMRTSQSHLEDKEKERRSVLAEIEKLQTTVSALEAEISALEGSIAKLTTERDALNERLDRSTPKAVKEKLKALRDRMDAISGRRATLAGERDQSKVQVTMFTARLKELEDRLAEIEGLKKKATEDKVKAEEREERYQKEVKALEKVLSSIDEKTKGLYEKLTALGRETERILGQREKARSDNMVQDQVIITQRTNIRVAEEKLAEVLRELQAYQGVALPERPYPSEKDLQKRVRDLEAILENVGNVNLKALEEYEEMDRKRAEIQEEMKALEKEKEELEKLISEIDQKRKDEFMHVFTEIDANFRHVYTLISGGGEAYFELENPEDPLAGGLNIHARPQGKKMTRLGALSGGEKSLTSMAFIFAVQAWDPSPFYLLDEVDQNLDAINAEIVARMVKDNSERAQFVIVSLRKVSLKEAHHLYGVTLQKGESVVLGRVDLKEVEAYEKGDGNKAPQKEAQGGVQ